MRLIRPLVSVVVLAAAVASCSSGRSPSRPAAQLSFGVDMARRGLWSEALFRFQQAERLDPGNPHVYNNLAVASEALGRFEDARKEYEAAMQRPGPLNVRARLEAALLMFDLGNAVGARESLDALARENPGEWEVQLSAAMLHAVTGNDAMAQKRLEDAGRLTATPPWRLARERYIREWI